MATKTTTITEVLCDRCGAVLTEQPTEPGPVLLSLGGELAPAIEWHDLCPRCQTAIADPIRRLLRQPSPKKAASDD